MDHDAMLTDVRKLKEFRANFLVLSRLTLTEFNAMADRARAGEDPHQVRGSVDEDGEQLGTDKSDGAVKHEGQELPPPGEKAPGSEADGSKTDETGTGQQTADLSGSGTPQSEDGTEAPAAPENAQAGSTGAATGV